MPARETLPLPEKKCLQKRYCYRVCFSTAFLPPLHSHHIGYATCRKDPATASHPHLMDHIHRFQGLCVHMAPCWAMAPRFIEPPQYKTCLFSWSSADRCEEKSATYQVALSRCFKYWVQRKDELVVMPLYRDVASSSPSLLPQIAQIVSSRSNNLSHQTSLPFKCLRRKHLQPTMEHSDIKMVRTI